MSTCHTTKTISVTYSAPVRDCVRLLRVFPPGQRGAQRIVSLDWECSPAPYEAEEYQDDFGNCVLELRQARIENEFRFHMNLVTTRHAGSVAPDDGLSPTGRGAFLLPSALCDLSDAIRQQARLLGGERSKRQDEEHASTLTAAICAWTHNALRYTPGVTNPTTTASQALQRGAGVCQDYAHLMIALCRALSLPARYISGYNPATGAMHAWVEVLCQGEWQAWDPTHNRPASEHCVFVGCGRDFRDVEPLLGTYRGCGTARLKVRCQTEVMERGEEESGKGGERGREG